MLAVGCRDPGTGSRDSSRPCGLLEIDLHARFGLGLQVVYIVEDPPAASHGVVDVSRRLSHAAVDVGAPSFHARGFQASRLLPPRPSRDHSARVCKPDEIHSRQRPLEERHLVVVQLHREHGPQIVGVLGDVQHLRRGRKAGTDTPSLYEVTPSSARKRIPVASLGFLD